MVAADPRSAFPGVTAAAAAWVCYWRLLPARTAAAAANKKIAGVRLEILIGRPRSFCAYFVTVTRCCCRHSSLSQHSPRLNCSYQHKKWSLIVTSELGLDSYSDAVFEYDSNR